MSSPIVWTCPVTRESLLRASLDETQSRAGAPMVPVARSGSTSVPVGATDQVLTTASFDFAYPVVDGIPVLLAPERLQRSDASEEIIDLTSERYAEAYAEMEFYNSGSVEDEEMLRILDAVTSDGLVGRALHQTFPEDRSRWLDARFDGPAQLDCYQHLGQMTDQTVMQIGGSGLHAVKFLLAGAARALLITPMIGEARRASWLAQSMGVSERLQVALGIAEELPLPSDSVDAIFAGGCAHHMQMSLAMPEINRVLRRGGRFAAAEPWLAPFYGVGTRIFGKREPNAHCRPLTPARVSPFLSEFEQAEIVHHGALTRYPLIAFSKLGLKPSLSQVMRVTGTDDRLSDRIGIRGKGSSVALLAKKTAISLGAGSPF